MPGDTLPVQLSVPLELRALGLRDISHLAVVVRVEEIVHLVGIGL